MRWGDLYRRAFRGALAILILNVAQSSICISAYTCVIFVWPHCLRALSNIGMGKLRGDKREREKGRTLRSPAVSGAHKDGPTPSLRLPLYLHLYLTYFSLFIPILKDSHSSFYTQTNFLVAIRYSSSQSIAICLIAIRELLSRLPVHEKPALSLRILQHTIREGR